jgi:GNAT superfamily N-acetyltransferase
VTSWISEPLGSEHDISALDCGVPSLNDWLKEQARRAQASDTARTYVWLSEGAVVVAYYAVTPTQVGRGEISGGMAGGVSLVPAYLLARLALDKALQGQGLGAELLHDALTLLVRAAEYAAARLIVVDALDEKAAKFYRRHDFIPVRDNPLRLAIKISTVRAALS